MRFVHIWEPTLDLSLGGKFLMVVLSVHFTGLSLMLAVNVCPPLLPLRPRLRDSNCSKQGRLMELSLPGGGLTGRPPQWSLPENKEIEGKWSELSFRTIRFTGHPQETTENSVDLAHLRYVHGYDNVYRVEPLIVDGSYLKSNFSFVRVQNVAGIKIKFDVSANANIYGLGFSNVMIHEKSVDMHINFYVLATPIDGKEIDMVLASQVKQINRPKRTIVGLGFLPLNLRTALMNRFILLMQKKDVMDDVHIWNKKRYVSQPRLCKSDGEIGRFRRYCKQFYQ